MLPEPSTKAMVEARDAVKAGRVKADKDKDRDMKHGRDSEGGCPWGQVGLCQVP